MSEEDSRNRRDEAVFDDVERAYRAPALSPNDKARLRAGVDERLRSRRPIAIIAAATAAAAAVLSFTLLGPREPSSTGSRWSAEVLGVAPRASRAVATDDVLNEEYRALAMLLEDEW